MENYQNPNEMNPFLVMGLIAITFGLFIIFWIYLKNKELQLIDANSPDPHRGIIVLGVLPLILIILLYITYLFINKIIFSYIFYFFIIILSIIIIKYLFDFSYSCAKNTKINITYWLIPLISIYFGIILLIFQYYLASILILISLIHIPLLQYCLNMYYKNLKIKYEKKKLFN